MLFSNLTLKYLFYCFILYTVLLYARYDCVSATTPWPKSMISCAFEMFAQLAIEVCGTNSVPIANGTYQYKSGVIPHKTFWFWNKLIHLDTLLSAHHFNSVFHLLSIVALLFCKRTGNGSFIYNSCSARVEVVVVLITLPLFPTVQSPCYKQIGLLSVFRYGDIIGDNRTLYY